MKKSLLLMLLKWQLHDDPEAAKYFVGRDCILCNDPGRRLKTRNIK